VYSDSACTVKYADAGVKTLNPDGSVPDSDAVTFNGVGTFNWQAVYTRGRENDADALSDGTTEVLTVTPKQPTSATTRSATQISAGGSVSDSATLSGAFHPTGTVTYTVYSDANCSAVVANAGTKTLNADGSVPGSDAVTFNGSGTFYWQAVYTSGDANNLGATSACQSGGLVVTANFQGCTPGFFKNHTNRGDSSNDPLVQT